MRYLNDEKIQDLIRYADTNGADLVAVAEHGRKEEDKLQEKVEELSESRWTWIANYREKYKKNTRRGSGGVGAIVKKCFNTERGRCKDTLWLKGVFYGKATRIGIVYLIPETSSRGDLEENEEVLLNLESDITKYNNEGDVLILGDFNSRIGELPSTIEEDGEEITFARTSKDKMINRSGRKIIDFADKVNMIICNGVIKEADFTRYETKQNYKNEGSVIDYVFANFDIFKRIKSLSILENAFEELDTDHYALLIEIDCPLVSRNSSEKDISEIGISRSTSTKWNRQKDWKDFKNCCNELMTSWLEERKANEGKENEESQWKEFKKILSRVGEKCNIIYHKTGNLKPKGKKVFVDKNLKEISKERKRLKKYIRKNPSRSDIIMKY